MSTIANRVKKGAELLDTAQPNWYEQIELSQLDLSSCKKCILGQMFGDFSDGAEVLFKDELSSSIDKCGFDIDRELLLENTPEEVWELLCTYWRHEVVSRRAKED